MSIWIFENKEYLGHLSEKYSTRRLTKQSAAFMFKLAEFMVIKRVFLTQEPDALCCGC